MVEDLSRGVEGEGEEHSDKAVLDREFGKLGIFQAHKHVNTYAKSQQVLLHTLIWNNCENFFQQFQSSN